MTERLYYHDCYLLEFEAGVTAVESGEGQYRVRLDRSAFYPTSGGQLYDTGLLGGHKVVDVVEDNGEIVHILNDQPSFAVGDRVEGKIDGARRRDNMQKHTGQHILSAALVEVCKAGTVSARLGDEDSTIDINADGVIEADIVRAERLANEIIFENRALSINFLSFDKLKELPLRKIPEERKGEYRIIVIDGFDWSACGGTHCSATGGVGLIKVTGLERVHGLLRIHFLTGLMALDDYRWRHEQIEAISNIFTRHGRESLEAVKALVEDQGRLRRKITELKKDMLPSLIEKWYSEAGEFNGDKVVAVDLSGEDFKDVKQIALAIINSHQVIALIGCDDKLMVAVAPELTYSASDIIKRAAEKFDGRGGGSPQVAQGGGFKPDNIKILLADPEAVLK